MRLGYQMRYNSTMGSQSKGKSVIDTKSRKGYRDGYDEAISKINDILDTNYISIVPNDDKNGKKSLLRINKILRRV